MRWLSLPLPQSEPMSPCSSSGWAISGGMAHHLRARRSSYAPWGCAILSAGRSPKKARNGELTLAGRDGAAFMGFERSHCRRFWLILVSRHIADEGGRDEVSTLGRNGCHRRDGGGRERGARLRR